MAERLTSAFTGQSGDPRSFKNIAKSRNMDRIGLHVFAQNESAYWLCRKLGFRNTGHQMCKRINA
jgi:hypothetical protein